jgi:protein-arginine kinase activator protein McsA
MTKICDDCFEEFEAENDEITVCKNCRNEFKQFDNADKTGAIWQVVQTRGFRSQAEINYYQFVKSEHKRLCGKDLPKVKEIIKGGK